MTFSINDVSKRTGLPASTLRYYEAEGILPPIKKDSSGRRAYDDQDLDMISVITCLKDTNMPIADIKRFVRLRGLGDETLAERRDLVVAHQKEMERQLAEFMRHMDHINFKVAYYTAACKAGTERELKKKPYASSLD